ncbi:uncharacterized protein KY384_000315 [Bacidia gigantensis]|uniref:uncharacterized protein n=1 Tax=Bacidia gigantensis TaxID=2732470 RepID=UPI001D042177|nr:uncharacterized protein KY384_000315 [Bacidia gigantensis]KAG8526322.1 hypothetical protein KY384_000315 [Bacidia gigantensis]
MGFFARLLCCGKGDQQDDLPRPVRVADRPRVASSVNAGLAPLWTVAPPPPRKTSSVYEGESPQDIPSVRLSTNDLRAVPGWNQSGTVERIRAGPFAVAPPASSKPPKGRKTVRFEPPAPLSLSEQYADFRRRQDV